MHGVRAWMAAFLHRRGLDRGRKRDDVVSVLRHRDQPALPLLGQEQRLGAGVEDAVASLELRAVDGEVGLVDQLVRIRPVARETGHADRDRRLDRLARGLDVEGTGCDGAPDPLCDLERLLRRGLRQEDGELLTAEPGGHVVVAQLLSKHLRDPLQDGVARKVAVGVIDVAQEVEVGHDERERPLETLGPDQLLAERDGEMACVEEAGLRIDTRLLLKLRDAQRTVDQQ